jgi:hypothetical protein
MELKALSPLIYVGEYTARAAIRFDENSGRCFISSKNLEDMLVGILLPNGATKILNSFQ